MIVIPAFRFESDEGIFFGFMRKKNFAYDVSLTDDLSDGLCAGALEFDSGRIKLRLAELQNMIVNPTTQNFMNVTTDGSVISLTTSSIASFALDTIGMSGDGKGVYAGVWYKLLMSGKVQTVSVRKPDSLGFGFPGTSADTTKTNMQFAVSFIPFETGSSVWNNGVCVELPSRVSAVQRFVSWVRSRYMGGTPLFESVGCDQAQLGQNSKGCVFVGTTCNSGIGYNYCMPYEACGKCFGKCSNGGKCLQNEFSKRFYCESVAVKKQVSYDPTGVAAVDQDASGAILGTALGSASGNLGGPGPTLTTTQTNKSNTGWIILVILLVFIFVGIVALHFYHRA